MGRTEKSLSAKIAERRHLAVRDGAGCGGDLQPYVGHVCVLLHVLPWCGTPWTTAETKQGKLHIGPMLTASGEAVSSRKPPCC